jgi:hypothetical protein
MGPRWDAAEEQHNQNDEQDDPHDMPLIFSSLPSFFAANVTATDGGWIRDAGHFAFLLAGIFIPLAHIMRIPVEIQREFLAPDKSAH